MSFLAHVVHQSRCLWNHALFVVVTGGIVVGVVVIAVVACAQLS